MDNNDLTLQPLFRKPNMFDDDYGEPIKDFMEKYPLSHSLPHSSRLHHQGPSQDSSYYHGEPLHSFGNFYNHSFDELEEKQRVEALIENVLQNNLDKLLPASDLLNSNQLAYGGSYEFNSEDHKPDLDDNILDYDNEMELLRQEQRKKEDEQRKNKGVQDIRTLSNKFKSLKDNFEQLVPTIKQEIEKGAQNISSYQLVWPKEIKNYITKKDKVIRSKIEHKYSTYTSITRAEIELDDSSLEASTIDERESKKKQKKAEKKFSDPFEAEDEDHEREFNLEESPRSSTNAGRKKSKILSKDSGDESPHPTESEGSSLSQTQLLKKSSSVHSKGSDGLGKRKERKDYSVYKNTRIPSSPPKEEKPHTGRGRPRKYPLKTNDSTEEKKVSTPGPKKDSPPPSSASKVVIGTPNATTSEKKKRGPKPSAKKLEEQQRKALIEESNTQSYIDASKHSFNSEEQQRLRDNQAARLPYGMYLTQENRTPSGFRLLDVHSQDDALRDSGISDRNNPMREDSIDYDTMQIFGKEPPMRRKYSSMEFNQHPINMMDEEDKDEANVVPDLYYQNNSMDSHRDLNDPKWTSDFNQPAAKNSDKPARDLMTNGGSEEQPVKRKRGRPKKIREGEGENKDSTTPAAATTLSTEPIVQKSSEKPEKPEKPEKKSKAKRTLAEAGITSPEGATEKSNEDPSKKKKKAKTGGKVRNQIGLSQEKKTSEMNDEGPSNPLITNTSEDIETAV